MSSRFLLAVACVGIPSLFKAEEHPIACIDRIPLTYSFISVQLGRVPTLAVVKNTAMNMYIQVSL